MCNIDQDRPSLGIEVLIGLNSPKELEPLNLVTGKKSQQFLYQIRFRLGIIGKAEASNDTDNIEHSGKHTCDSGISNAN